MLVILLPYLEPAHVLPSLLSWAHFAPPALHSHCDRDKLYSLGIAAIIKLFKTDKPEKFDLFETKYNFSKQWIS